MRVAQKQRKNGALADFTSRGDSSGHIDPTLTTELTVLMSLAVKRPNPRIGSWPLLLLSLHSHCSHLLASGVPLPGVANYEVTSIEHSGTVVRISARYLGSIACPDCQGEKLRSKGRHSRAVGGRGCPKGRASTRRRHTHTSRLLASGVPLTAVCARGRGHTGDSSAG